MKRMSIGAAAVVLLWMGGTAFGGYRDLKREMDAYVPPVMLYGQGVAQPPADPATDDFQAARQVIETARERWRHAVSDRAPILAGNDIAPDLVHAAADDHRTLALLQDRFSLQTVESLILLRNPAVQGAVDRLEAALQGFDQVTQLDEMLRQYSAYTAAVMPGVGPMRGMGEAIEMKFPFPGVTALKVQVAEQNVAAEKEALEMVRRDTVAQGSKAYWNLLYTHQAIRITRDTRGRLDQLESVATTRYGAGKTSYQDVIKIRIGREKLEEQLDTLGKQRVNLETELLTLMDLMPGAAIGPPKTRTPNLSLPGLAELYPLALSNRQELRRMRVMVGKMERMLEMAETMIQPSFSQNYALYSDEAVVQAGSAGMKPTFGTSLSTTRGQGLPKNAWFGTRDAYLRETRHRLGALRADLADAEARTRLMVRQGWFDLDRARRERALYRNRLLELARTSLEVSTRGYETGDVSFADVIASYNGWLDINLSSERRNSDVGIARVELERRVGTRLPGTSERTLRHDR